MYQKLFLAVVFALITACSPETYKGTDISNVQWGGDFELTAHTGKRVHASDFKGKAVVLFFGFTRCPDICAPTLTRLAQAMKLLGADAPQVQVLFISVDPRHDDPGQLSRFVPTFHPSFLGLTGTEQEITAVAREYRISAQTDPGHPDQISHSGAVLVKDARGKLRLLIKGEASAEDIAYDLRLILKDG